MKALVLSGGGSLGAFQVGALEVLLADGREYDLICGVSVGALNAAFLGQAPQGKLFSQLDKLKELWLRLHTKDVHRKWPFWGELAALWKTSVYDSAPLRRLVRDNLNVQAVRDSGREVYVGAVEWSSGEYRAESARSADFADWVLASSSYPVFLQSLKIEGRLWTDGGLRNVTPLGDAIRMGATAADVIMCSAEQQKPWAPMSPNALQYALRAVEVLADEVVRNDVKMAFAKNELAAHVDTYRTVNLKIIQPRVPMEGNSLDFDPRVTEERIREGHAAAREA